MPELSTQMRTNRASLNGLINENGPSLTPTLTKLLSAATALEKKICNLRKID